MNNTRSLGELIQKIDAFIRMYYKNRIIRGIIYSVGLLVVFFLLLNFLEYFSYFGKTTRAILFFGYLIFAIILLYAYIIEPLLRLLKIRKTITHEQAANIISRHFPEISDRLINTLQLGSMTNHDEGNLEVLEAAIRQKTEKIRHIPFTEAIDKKENVRKMPYALIPLLIVILIFIAAPSMIREPAHRISTYRTHYERPMPFSFVIQNEDLSVLKGEDLDIYIKLTDKELPAEIFIEFDKKVSRCIRVSNTEFIYRFKNISKNQSFKLQGGGFYSDDYKIKVVPRPVIINYTVSLEYPAYIRRQNEEIANTGDFSVPIGTNITWKFNTEAVDSVFLKTNISEKPTIKKLSDNSFSTTVKVMESFDYVIIPQNSFTISRDSLLHQITVIPDMYPEIMVETLIDSSNYNLAFYTGQIKDDYGFDKLDFIVKKRNVKHPDKILEDTRKSINIDRSVNSQTFFYNADFSDINIEPGDRIEYWFEVWDNDRINGSKSTRSSLGTVEVPGIAEREQQIADRQNEMTTEMTSVQKELLRLSKEIEQLQKTILQKESISWEDTQKLQQMLEQQQELQSKVEKLKDENTALNRLQNEINPYNEDIMKKQQELQKLFDDIMTDEMKKLFEDIQNLLDKLDREKMQDALNQMKLSNKDLMDDLDRTLELFKQLEMEKMITETVEKLNKLAEEQDELLKETSDAGSDSEELDKKQEEIAEQFEKIKEDINKLEEKNEELEEKYDMIETGDTQKDIENSMQKSRENLQKNQKKNAAPHQKDASDKMKEMAENFMDMMMQMQNEQLGEDIKMVRKLLEDLVDISFDQEDMIDKTININKMDPRFNQILSDQKKINDDLRLVEDSLNAIARRQLAIQQFILREISQINHNVEETLKSLEDRNISVAGTRQQFVMTSINNLALMLSEALEQMNEDMMSNSDDGSSCPNPGSGQGKSKKNMKSMKDLQQQMNQQMEQLKNQMGKQGEEGKPMPGGQTMSEQFARMAAQQEALRRQMQDYIEELKKETGKGDGNAMKAIEEMEETEKDLVHKRITNETLLRQERILTRLLESEKAEMEREQEERRESREAEDYPVTSQDSIIEIYRKKMAERELFRTIPPQMNSFYRTKVNNYFIQVQ